MATIKPLERGEIIDTIGALPDVSLDFDEAITIFRDQPKRGGKTYSLMLSRALSAAERRLEEQRKRIAYLESLSRTDELTGLLNRRGFMEELRRALGRARRAGEAGVVLYCDLDGFKAVNDRYGHSAGDAMLRHVATLLCQGVREIDAVARLGGDEFAVLLADTSRRDGSKRARALERALSQSHCVHQGVQLPVAVSIGQECYGAEDDADALLARADMAMYCAKRRKETTRLHTAAE